jgi:hypothetical protein
MTFLSHQLRREAFGRRLALRRLQKAHDGLRNNRRHAREWRYRTKLSNWHRASIASQRLLSGPGNFDQSVFHIHSANFVDHDFRHYCSLDHSLDWLNYFHNNSRCVYSEALPRAVMLPKGVGEYSCTSGPTNSMCVSYVVTPHHFLMHQTCATSLRGAA